MTTDHERIVRLNVWIHSHEETGKPLEVDVLEIDGHVNMQWFSDVFHSKYNNSDLAEQFYEHLGKLDDSAWFNVTAEWETSCGLAQAYIDVIGLAAT